MKARGVRRRGLAIAIATGSLLVEKNAQAAAGEPSTARGKQEDGPTETSKREPGWVAMPVISYAPETSLTLGGFVLHHFGLDAASFPTTLSLLLMVTLKKQVIAEFKPELYWDQNSYRLEGYFEGQEFPDRFYGTGNVVSDGDAEDYDRRFVRARIKFRRRVIGDLYAGIATDQLWMDVDADDPDGLFATREYVGESGGFTSGFGVTGLWDTRDNRTYTTHGQLAEVTLIPYFPAFGSDFEFVKTQLDLRSFWATWKNQVLGLRYTLEIATSDVPFYLMPYLGGANLLRGYFQGKYRDKTAQTLEAEYRFHLFWRLGAVAFAGAGQVGSSVEEMLDARPRPSVGGGLRFDLSGGEDINLRVDAGWWPGDFGFYVAMLEVF